MAEDRADASMAASTGRRDPPSTCVVGIGTIGLDRAVAFDAAGHDVVGFDVDDDVVAACRRGVDPTGTVGTARVADADCLFTTDPRAIGGTDYVFISVPTRFDDDGTGLEAVVDAGETVGANLHPGSTVVLESTVPPGATEDTLVPAITSASALSPGDGFEIAYSPERRSPGLGRNPERTRTRLVAAPDPEVARAVAGLYERIGEEPHVVADVRTAEAAKCVENVQRDVNVALANDLASSLGALDLDPHAVFDAAATKWNVQRYRPGPVGGECLPVDPYLLDDRATRAGSPVELARLARAVNERVPRRLVEATVAAFAERRDAMATPTAAVDGEAATESVTDGGAAAADSPRVVLLGLAYKPESPTLQGAPSIEVASRLTESGVDAVGFDPHVDRERAENRLGVTVQEELSVADADGLVVLLGHRAFDRLSLDDLVPEMRPRPVIVDVPGVFDPNADVTTIYRGVGDVS